MLWLFLSPRSYLLTGYALLSMPALTPTPSNITSESSIITRTTVTSGLSHPMNSSDASDSSTKSLIAYHTLLTNLHWSPWCHPALQHGSSRKIHLYLLYLRDANSEIFLPSQFAFPAATIQAFGNGAIGIRFPSQERWIQAYSNDTEMSAIRDLVLNPSKINSSTLYAGNHNYRAPLWQSQIVIKNGLLIYHKPMRGGSSYTCLQLVPSEFYNIIFIAFHSNDISSHFNAYRTLHRICLRYYWPGMYSYSTCICNACPGCALANPTKSKHQKRSYAPFMGYKFIAYLCPWG